MSVPATPAVRNRLPLMALLAANAVSLVGNMLAAIGIPWFVLQTTGSAAQTGITGFFTILPVVLAGFLGGTLIDRLGYRRTSVIADLASGITVALIPLLHFSIGLEFWQLMALVFLGALLDAPGNTARDAMIPELAELAGMPIERATALIQIIERGSRLVGAPLAGVLIAVMGTANMLWADAVSFSVSAAAVLLVVPAAQTRPAAAAQGRYFDQLLEGMKFLRGDRLILSMVIIIMVTNFLDAAFGGVVLPVYVDQVFDDALNLGLIIAAGGGGAVVGALIFGAVGHRLSRFGVFLVGFVLTGLRFWVFLFYPSLGVILLAGFVAGVAAGPINPIIGAVEFERIPPDMRGRVFGAVTAGAWVAMPLGTLLGGLFTERFGLGPVLTLLGLAYLVTTLSIALVPDMRAMNRPPVSLPAGG
ncbi:MAG: MFS transporter [Chloroflexi bacterium]|nr:MFS transporter [Anaerolineaceae bacterium]NMB89403.1 MFS transporter [Chloroflexota bacterium]